MVLSRLNLPDISPLGSIRFPPHWQLIGSQFSIVSPYTLLVTTDPLSVPSGNHVIPKNPPPLPVSMTVPDSFATFADVRRAYNTCQLSLKFLKYVGGTFFLSPMNSSFAFFVSPAERQGDEKLVYKLIQLFSSTEIFSKRRKICA